LPTYVNEVPHARAKDIDFLSAKKIWSKKSMTRELRIYNSPKPRAMQQVLVLGLHRPAHQRIGTVLQKKKWLSFMANLTSAKVKQ